MTALMRNSVAGERRMQLVENRRPPPNCQWNLARPKAVFRTAMLPEVKTLEGAMPIIPWLLGVPFVVVVLLMLTHVI
jgi:hypothetical protein